MEVLLLDSKDNTEHTDCEDSFWPSPPFTSFTRPVRNPTTLAEIADFWLPTFWSCSNLGKQKKSLNYAVGAALVAFAQVNKFSRNWCPSWENRTFSPCSQFETCQGNQSRHWLLYFGAVTQLDCFMKPPKFSHFSPHDITSVSQEMRQETNNREMQ